MLFVCGSIDSSPSPKVHKNFFSKSQWLILYEFLPSEMYAFRLYNTCVCAEKIVANPQWQFIQQRTKRTNFEFKQLIMHLRLKLCWWCDAGFIFRFQSFLQSYSPVLDSLNGTMIYAKCTHKAQFLRRLIPHNYRMSLMEIIVNVVLHSFWVEPIRISVNLRFHVFAMRMCHSIVSSTLILNCNLHNIFHSLHFYIQ